MCSACNMFTMLALSMNMPSKRLDAMSPSTIVFCRMVLAAERKATSGEYEAFSKSKPENWNGREIAATGLMRGLAELSS